MSADIQNLEPKSLWKNFALLNAVPRASRKEERVIEFAKNFGENLGCLLYTSPSPRDRG